mgnify:CR=1 FL=1
MEKMDAGPGLQPSLEKRPEIYFVTPKVILAPEIITATCGTSMICFRLLKKNGRQNIVTQKQEIKNG